MTGRPTGDHNLKEAALMPAPGAYNNSKYRNSSNKIRARKLANKLSRKAK